jgi:long-subunit fatty acid transport protein
VAAVRAILVAISVVLAPVPSVAGGMVLPVRGVRSLAQGGALIAGASDADALWQNPAGVAHARGDGRRALLFDLALVYQPVEYTTTDGVTVTNQQPSQPVPTLAGSLGIGDRLVIAGGIATPYAALHRYDAAGPTRYASISSTSSTSVLVTVGAAYHVSDRLRVGVTVQNLFTKLAASVVMSGCPPQATCAADDRSLDMPVEIAQTDYFAPSASLGVQLDASSIVTLGLAIQAPTRVSGQGTLTAKLPTSTMFENGRITGDDAAIAFTLPAAVRAGVEVRPVPQLRLEAALDVELWSLHDEITIEPEGIQIENVTGGPYAFGPMAIARDYSTSFAPSLGIEYHAPRFVVGAGYAYESAAAPAGTVSVLTVDAAKHLIAIGGGYAEEGWQIGGAIAYVSVADVEVTPDVGGVTQLAPIRGAPVDARVNAGSYTTSFMLAGVRFARRW